MKILIFDFDRRCQLPVLMPVTVLTALETVVLLKCQNFDIKCHDVNCHRSSNFLSGHCLVSCLDSRIPCLRQFQRQFLSYTSVSTPVSVVLAFWIIQPS